MEEKCVCDVHVPYTVGHKSDGSIVNFKKRNQDEGIVPILSVLGVLKVVEKCDFCLSSPPTFT